MNYITLLRRHATRLLLAALTDPDTGTVSSESLDRVHAYLNGEPDRYLQNLLLKADYLPFEIIEITNPSLHEESAVTSADPPAEPSGYSEAYARLVAAQSQALAQCSTRRLAAPSKPPAPEYVIPSRQRKPRPRRIEDADIVIIRGAALSGLSAREIMAKYPHYSMATVYKYMKPQDK